jgi:hypothetical protein
MREKKHLERACTLALERMDAYLDREMPEAAAAEMDAHLAGCAACREEAAARTQLRMRLRGAVLRSAEAPAFLGARIRANLQAPARAAWWRKSWVPAAALAGLGVAGVIGYQVLELRLTVERQENYIAAVSSRVASILRVGLGDHIHCAVFRKYPKKAPAAETLAAELGPKHGKLVEIVKERAPKGFELVMAHECGFHGRRFVHLAMKSETKLISLVIVKKEDGESFQAAGLVPALREAGLPMYEAGAENFSIAAFESGRHLAYLISDLPAGENRNVMLALAGDVEKHLNGV